MNELNEKSLNNDALIDKILLNRKKALKKKDRDSIKGLEKPVLVFLKPL